MRRFIAIFGGFWAVLAFSGGCKRTAPASAVKLIGGTADDANKWPATVLLTGLQDGNGNCSGTFLNETTLITAGHCVTNSRTGDYVLPYVGESQALTVFWVSGFSAVATACADYCDAATAVEFSKNDIGLAVFSADVTSGLGLDKSDFPAIETRSLSPGDAGSPIMIVGYGRTDAQANDEGQVRRFGENSLTQVNPDYLVYQRIDDAAARANTGASHGDSGGPIYLEEPAGGVGLIGVTSIVPNADSGQYELPNLQSDRARAFFDSAINHCDRSPCAQSFAY